MPKESLLSVKDAQLKILEHFKSLESHPVELLQAVNRILAVDIRANVNLPPFDNSSVDGFAVQFSSFEKDRPAGWTLKVVSDIPAGVYPGVVIKTGQAARIMTGAPIPSGANCVVPVEDTNIPNRNSGAELPDEITILHKPSISQNIRPLGQDLKTGDLVLAQGHRLRPQDIAMLATLGHNQVPVIDRPRVAIFSSGDELVEPGNSLEMGKIYDSNRYALSALVEKYGGEPILLGIARDRADAVRSMFEQAVEAGADLILTSAGVSVGAYDYVRAILEESGSLKIWRVNMRPGKPFAFGDYRGVPVISLPGNPVSSFVGFHVFGIPVIRKLTGSSQPLHRNTRIVKLEEPVFSDGRESYLRAIVEENPLKGPTARLAEHQGSGNVYSLVRANALLIVPPGVKSLPIMDEVEAWMLD